MLRFPKSFLSLALVLVAGAAHAQEHTVTRVGIVAKPAQYTGACPAEIRFIATIFVSHHPVKVRYRWERSDGAKSPPEDVEITSAGRGVETTWKLGAPHEHMTVSERLHVLAPTGISSEPATASIQCR